MKAEQIPYQALRPDVGSFWIRPILRHIDPVKLNEPPHRHEFQELLWIKRGSGQHQIDQDTLTIEPNSFYLISRGQVHYFTEGVDLEGYVIRFTDDFLVNSMVDIDWDYRMTLFNHFAIHRSLKIEDPGVATFDQIITAIVSEQANDGFGSRSILSHLLSILLIRLERSRLRLQPSEQPLPQNANTFQDFITTLDKSFTDHHHVRFYADQLHISPRQLSDIATQFAGKTAKQVIQDRLMLEALRYLKHTNSSVKEIAYQLGYREPSYFSKVFKQNVGMSPHQYKATM